jgi:hypothetical protein
MTIAHSTVVVDAIQPEIPAFGGMFIEVLGLLAIELGLTWVFLSGYELIALTVHWLILAAYWHVIARNSKTGSWRREQIRKLLALSTATLGPFGAGGTFLTLVRLRIRYASVTPFEQWYKTLFPETEITRPDFLHRLLIRSGSAITGNVSPFADIMAGLDESRKRRVLALIIENFTPAYVPALKRGLTDSDPTIRVSAATAMAAIEGRYLTRGVALERYVERDPDDPRVKRALADHFDDYASSGLLDSIRADEMRERALALYLMCIGSDPEIENRIGRLQVHLGHLDDADRTFDRLLASHPDYLPALPWEMELLYRRNRFGALRQLARKSGPRLSDDFTMPTTIRDAIREWQGVPS